MADTGTNPQDLFEQSGISEEEQSEVIEHIERVATENRIRTSPELFSLKEVRPGLLFPFLVDGIAVAVIVIAVLLLALVFRHNERQMVSTSGVYTSVEGRLIRALQQESQQRLLDKDQQIAVVKSRLTEVERQRRELAANMEAKIKQREEEYRLKIRQELQVERERLVRQEVASDELARMLATYEAERKAFYDRQLADYRRQLEGERAAVEKQLAQLKREYESQILTLQNERDRLVSEYRERADALQAQLEQRTRVLDIARVEAIQNLASAQARVQQLSHNQEQTSVIQDQILGQFEQIRRSLQANDTRAATAAINTLQAYLTDDRVVSIAELSRQREMDLYLLDALRRIVQGQQQAERSVSNLATDLVLLNRLRETASEAARAQASGDTVRADKLYADLLAYVPVIANAHSAVLSEAKGEAIREAMDTQQRALVDRQQQMADEIARLNSERAMLQRQISEQTASAKSDIRRRDREIADLKSEISRLRTFERRVTTLQTEYRRYSEREDSALRSNRPNAIMDGKLALEAFLASPEMTRLFPDFGRRLRGYDAAFQKAGRASGLQEGSDIIQTLSGFQNTSQQQAYLDAQIERTTQDGPYREFLVALRQYLR